MPQLIVPSEALAHVLEAAAPLPPVNVSIAESLGRAIGEDVRADRDYPPFDRAMMDGYAVTTVDAGKTIGIEGEIAAGQASNLELHPGSAIAIMTGAPCPPGTEAVVQKERVTVEGNRVTLPGDIVMGANIAARGSECAAGQEVIAAGTLISPLHIALLATFGLDHVRVTPPASVHIVVTGRELVARQDAPGAAQIRNSNAPMLHAFVTATGANSRATCHAGDEADLIAAALHEGAGADCIITTGGVSAGNYDLVPEALQRFGAEIVFHGVEQRPGKPMLFARRGKQLIFGLSGNPMACLVGFNRYAMPALRKLMNMLPPCPTFTGALTAPLSGRGTFTYYATGRAHANEGGWAIDPISGKGSADMYATANANALIHVPPGAQLNAGDVVTFQLFPGQDWSR